jgi:aqualysin 1
MNPRHSKSRLSALLGLALVACNGLAEDEGASPTDGSPAALVPAACPSPAPLHLASGNKVPDSYIVVFKDEVEDSLAHTRQLEQRHGFTATFRYESALKGFAARLPPSVVAALRCEPAVAYLEEDAQVRAY